MNTHDVAFLLLGLILPALVLWMRHLYSYWRKNKVPSVKPTPVIGNLKNFIIRKQNAAELFSDIYNHPNAENQPVIGFHIFFMPRLMIRDLELVKLILVKDFNKFSNRSATTDEKRDGLGWNNLFMIKNPKWKDLRSKLTPFFSSGKLKMMFPLIEEIGSQLDTFLLSFDEEESIHNARELTSAYTTDVIASVAFGVSANSLKNPNGDFRWHGRNITTIDVFRGIEIASIFFFPRLVYLIGAKQFSKKGTAFFRKSISFVMEQRETTGVVRNDLIDILLAFKKSEDFDGNMDFLVAQAALFFSAGFHTSASALTFALYELAKNQDIQDKLRNEIKETLTKSNGKITYDNLSEFGYLEMVLDETLRLYPTLPFLDRRCELPDGEREYSLRPYIDFAIPNGMPVSIPFFAIQRDPKYFPDPLKFDPERFSPKNKPNIVPFSYLPFGIGPRACIGERLARIQTKVGLIRILKNHRIAMCDETPKEIVFNPSSMVTQEVGDILVKFIKDPLMKGF